MPRNTPDHDRLLAETSLGDWTTGPAARFARAAARSVRRRHRLKRVVPAGAALFAFAGVALFTQRTTETAPPSSPPHVAPASPPPAYEIISDAQLLALVTDRPLLVVQNSPDVDPVIMAFER